MDISSRCWPGLGYPKLEKLNHGYFLSVQTRYGISQKLKRYTYGVQTCIWFIHGIACDNQRYPWICKDTKSYQRVSDSRWYHDSSSGKLSKCWVQSWEFFTHPTWRMVLPTLLQAFRRQPQAESRSPPIPLLHCHGQTPPAWGHHFYF